MIENNKQIFIERFKELPPIIQKVITKSNWLEKVRLITEKNGLLLDQGTIVENIVFSIMLGLLDPRMIQTYIVEDAGVEKQKAEAIIFDLEVQIFSTIKKELVDAFEQLELSQEEQKEKEPEESREDILKQIEDDGDTEINQGPILTDKPTPLINPIINKLGAGKSTNEQSVIINNEKPKDSSTTDPYREPVI